MRGGLTVRRVVGREVALPVVELVAHEGVEDALAPVAAGTRAPGDQALRGGEARVRAAAAIRRRVHDEEEQEDGALALVGGALGAAAALLGAGSRVLVGSALRGAGDQREDPDEKQRTGSAHDLLVESGERSCVEMRQGGRVARFAPRGGGGALSTRCTARPWWKPTRKTQPSGIASIETKSSSIAPNHESRPAYIGGHSTT